MKKNILIVLLAICIPFAIIAQKGKANKETLQWRYEIEAGDYTGSQGSYLVKVWTYSKDPNTAINQAQKNAVHAILFKGFPGKVVGQNRVNGQKALITDPNIEQTKEAFFEEFFKDGGNFQKYVFLANNGDIEAGDRIKVGKEYKIGVVVSVNAADLRKYLESENIIKSLSSGF